MTNWVDKSAVSTIYLTPPRILDPTRVYFGGPIPLDPATQPDNPTGALKFYTAQDDGLVQPWDAPVFINPPYSKLLAPFLERIHLKASAGLTILALLPCGARFSTKYWQADALNPYLNSILFIKGRVKFLREDGTVAAQNPYDSQLYGYNVDVAKFNAAFGHLGKCLEVYI